MAYFQFFLPESFFVWAHVRKSVLESHSLPPKLVIKPVLVEVARFPVRLLVPTFRKETSALAAPIEWPICTYRLATGHSCRVEQHVLCFSLTWSQPGFPIKPRRERDFLAHLSISRTSSSTPRYHHVSQVIIFFVPQANCLISRSGRVIARREVEMRSR